MNGRIFSVPGLDDEPFEGDMPLDPVSESQARSSLHGKEYDAQAREYLEGLGAQIVDLFPHPFGYRLDFLVEGANGCRFYVDAHGSPDQTDRPQAGLRRQDTVLKFGYKAFHMSLNRAAHPLVVLTSHLPKPGSSSFYLLAELGIDNRLWDAVATVGDLGGLQRLSRYFDDTPVLTEPLPAPWRARAQPFEFDFDDDGP